LFILSLFILILIACAPTPNHPGEASTAQSPTIGATPTLLGTVNPPTPAAPTATPRPTTCFFRTDTQTEIGLYRFDWQNYTFTLDTRIGAAIVDGPRTLTPGPRQLILVHNFDLPPSFGLTINFDVGGTLIYDPGAGVQEVRDAGGTIIIQNMTDPLGDARGLPDYLDIVRLERSFGYYPNSTVRVFLAGVRTGTQIWTFQNFTVRVGDETYTRQSMADGKINLTVADSQGRIKEWPGPATAEGNIVAFDLQTGVDQAAAASTSTSGGEGDSIGPYPVGQMQTLWETAKKFCP
jgi:hypothetical protein